MEEEKAHLILPLVRPEPRVATAAVAASEGLLLLLLLAPQLEK